MLYRAWVYFLKDWFGLSFRLRNLVCLECTSIILKVTVQFEQEEMAKMRLLAMWIDQK